MYLSLEFYIFLNSRCDEQVGYENDTYTETLLLENIFIISGKARERTLHNNNLQYLWLQELL